MVSAMVYVMMAGVVITVLIAGYVGVMMAFESGRQVTEKIWRRKMRHAQILGVTFRDVSLVDNRGVEVLPWQCTAFVVTHSEEWRPIAFGMTPEEARANAIARYISMEHDDPQKVREAAEWSFDHGDLCVLPCSLRVAAENCPVDAIGQHRCRVSSLDDKELFPSEPIETEEPSTIPPAVHPT